MSQQGGKIFLNIGCAGVRPWVYPENNELKGSDLLLVKLLSEKLGFTYDVTLERNYDDLFKGVKQAPHSLLYDSRTEMFSSNADSKQDICHWFVPSHSSSFIVPCHSHCNFNKVQTF